MSTSGLIQFLHKWEMSLKGSEITNQIVYKTLDLRQLVKKRYTIS